MGKGDKKTEKGKRFAGTYGKHRNRKKIKQRKRNKKKYSKRIKRMGNSVSIHQLDRLYILSESIEQIIASSKVYLAEEKDKKKKNQLVQSIKVHENQLNAIKKRIARLRKNLLQFSIEELYAMYGKYDKFISIDFHPDSESAEKFGKSIMGILLFNRRERQDIDKVIEQDQIPRTNGFVKIDPSELSQLSKEQVQELQSKGFMSGDINAINHTAIDYHDKYKDQSTKEIPGTINIEVDFSDFNHELLAIDTYKKRIKDNSKPLIDSEWDEYYSYKILYEESEISDKEWEERIYIPGTKKIKERIMHNILWSKIGRNIQLSNTEAQDLIQIMKNRTQERDKIVNKEISRSASKSLKAIIEGNKKVVTELKSMAYFFEEKNLSPYDAKHPVYLDLERYLHIYVEHFKDFQIEDYKHGKTSFQYNFEDTERLIKSAIEKLQPKIDEAINNKKEFKIWDKKAFNFNGNFYAIHIDNTGRLLSFYPHKNQ